MRGSRHRETAINRKQWYSKRKKIGRASCRKEGRSLCDWSSDVCSSDLEGCCPISRKVWKYPRRRWSSSLRLSISLATGWISQRYANHSACDGNGKCVGVDIGKQQ